MNKTWSLVSNSSLESLQLKSSVYSLPRSSYVEVHQEIFHERSSYHKRSSAIIKYCLQLKVILHWGMSSIKSCPPSKVIFNWRLSSIKSRPILKITLHQRSSSIKGYLSSKVFFLQRSSSIKSFLPSNVIISSLILYRKFCLLQTDLWVPPFKGNMSKPSSIFEVREIMQTWLGIRYIHFDT